MVNSVGRVVDRLKIDEYLKVVFDEVRDQRRVVFLCAECAAQRKLSNLNTIRLR